MSYVQSFYHLVFSTKYRRMTLPLAISDSLYRYLVGIARNLDSYVLKINGIENHVHILVSLSSKVALADFVRELKRASSIWLKEQLDFKDFQGWGKEYFAASVSRVNVEAVSEYISNQREHHRREDFTLELKRFVESIGKEWNDSILQ